MSSELSPSKSEEEAKWQAFKKKLEEHEAKEQAKAQLFKLEELARSTREIRTVEHPKLGIIRFKVLTARDLFEIARIQDETDRMVTAVWKCLWKADSSVKKEDVADLPWDVIAELLRVMGLAGFFTSPPSASGTG
jgi:hypothetical protein